MVVCKICNYDANKAIQAHLNHSHKLKNDEYRNMYPGAEIYSEEYLKNFSVLMKNLWKDPLYRATATKKQQEVQSRASVIENHKRGANKYFEDRSPEQEKAHNDALKASWSNEIVKENRVAILKEAHNRTEVKERHSEATKGYYKGLTDKQKEEKRITLKKVWAKPQMREKLLKLSAKGLEAAMSPQGRANLKLSNLKPEVRERRSRAAASRLANMPVVSSLNIRFKKELERIGLQFEA
jgi:hypothetical protein